MFKDKVVYNREIVGWAMFDFANQAYTTLIITVVFGVVFTRVIVGDGPDFRLGNLLWSVSLCVSYLLSAAVAPFCGAVMDYSAAKKKFLFASYVLTVITTACFYFILSGMVFPAMVLIVISNFSYSIGEAFIAGFLPELGPPDRLGRISGFGWALGYAGGLCSTGVVLLGLGGISVQNFQSLRLVGPLAAGFFLVGALPTFLWLKERKISVRSKKIPEYVKIGFQRLAETIGAVKRFRDLAVFLLALFFSMAGLYIVISFTFIFGDQVIRWSAGVQMTMFILTQVTAAAGALFFGNIQDRIGAKRTFAITLVLWIFSVLLIYFTPGVARVAGAVFSTPVHPQYVFLAVGCSAGTGLGATQSSARAMVGLLTPKGRHAEFFGFWGMTIKLAAVFGILGLGILQMKVGLKAAVLLCLVFFAIALLTNTAVDEKRGLAAAGCLRKL
ncbi:MAG TPA: MFS transporter [Desulfobacteraceae bacterium]|nr:MFS transporter [Desulfobacteraceae bacterium]